MQRAPYISMWYFGVDLRKVGFFVSAKGFLDCSKSIGSNHFCFRNTLWFDLRLQKVIEKKKKNLMRITHSFSLFSPMHKWNLPFLGFSSVRCIHLRSFDVNETNMLFLHLCHSNARLQLQLYSCCCAFIFIFNFSVNFSIGWNLCY